MANRKISDLTALTAPATGDLLPIVDISEAAAADKNKKITYGNMFTRIPAGIGFPATAVASADVNTLDDYEEGTWTPSFFRGTSEIVSTQSGNQSRYTKIGRLVVVSCGVFLSAVTSQSTGNNIIQGLPFTPATGTFSNNGSVGSFSAAATPVTAQVATDGAVIFLDEGLSVTATNWTSGGYVGFTLSYIV